MSENNEGNDTQPMTLLEKLNADFAAIVPGDITKGAKYIADHPAEYGIVWGYEPVQGRVTKGGPLVVLSKTAPRLWVNPEQVLLFVKTFGPEILSKSAKGTSLDVKSEGIDRETLLANRGTSVEQLKEKLVNSILFSISARGGVTLKFVDNEGTSWGTAEEAKASNVRLAKIADLAAKVAEVEEKAEFLGEVSDRGGDVEKARQLIGIVSVTQARTIMELDGSIGGEVREEQVAE